jgi:hypothetical protein
MTAGDQGCDLGGFSVLQLVESVVMVVVVHYQLKIGK